MKPLDQGVADRGALSISLRSFSVDLSVPNDFRQLYGLPGRDPGDGRYYRTQGALHAVFPESAYVRRGGRILPLVPAGTVFHIGPPEELLGAANAPRSARAEAERLLHTEAHRIDGRIEARIDAIVDVGETGQSEASHRETSHRETNHGESSHGESSHFRRPAPPPRPLARDAVTDAATPSRRESTAAVSEPLPRFLRDEAYRRERLRGVER